MLTPKELSSLLSILDDHTKQFEVQTNHFVRTYAKKDHFRIACSIYLLLQNGVLSLGARLAAYFLLYDMYKAEPLSSNPFLPIFVAPFRNPASSSASVIESRFLTYLLDNPQKDFAKNSAADFLSSTQDPRVQQPSKEFLNNLIKGYTTKLASVSSAFSRVGITPPVIDDIEDVNLFGSDHNVVDQESARQDVLQKLLTVDGFEPRYLRPPPPLLNPTVNELMWLNPEEDRVLLWDYGQAAPCLSTTKAKELLNLAMKESLSFEKLELLKQSLQRDPQLTQIVSPNKLSDLIERNKILAAEVLLQFMSTPQIGQYFAVLLEMKNTLQYSMEVVNALTKRVELPKDFVNSFIYNCIRYCQNVQDRVTQTRMVKLVCVFFDSLIRHKIIDVREVEEGNGHFIETFCLEHSRTKEAAALYKFIKSQLDDSNK